MPALRFPAKTRFCGRQLGAALLALDPVGHQREREVERAEAEVAGPRGCVELLADGLDLRASL